MSTSGFDPKKEQARLLGLMGLGVTFGCELIAGLAIGWLLDKWLDTEHLFLIIGTILGLLVGTLGFFKSAMKANRAAAKRARTLSGSDP
ncbi:MAG: AtpZ/AtpI family protein [Phycisphaerales bacterium]|nr:AtpZ/AtpI family protein [Phycisphaerales bacterium]